MSEFYGKYRFSYGSAKLQFCSLKPRPSHLRHLILGLRFAFFLMREMSDVFENKVREVYQDLKEESKKISQNEELCTTQGREVYVKV